MSIRPEEPQTQGIQLRRELDALRHSQMTAQAIDNTPADQVLTFEQLNETEKSAASLGVHADAWRPMAFMNNAHYSSLLKGNKLDSQLAQRIEAFRHVSSQ